MAEEKKGVICDKCGESFDSEEELQEHAQKEHSEQ
jgi:hypothetical protein